GLKWFRSVTDETPNVHRGFCQECGASLFWDPRGSDHIYVSAGTLDAPTGLKTVGHVWTSQVGDYYEITDNLPAFEESSHGQLVGKH
ncbi:MAG: GFA family protein, partial [Deltaproteobacteria bacterium]|nr:GFA family protein [Deltaproteobacteria bacterium]